MSTGNIRITHTPTLGLLGCIFVTLKLTGYISWSWWWVTAPFWAVPAIFITLLGIGLIAYLKQN
jgi:hypothetical protein